MECGGFGGRVEGGGAMGVCVGGGSHVPGESRDVPEDKCFSGLTTLQHSLLV